MDVAAVVDAKHRDSSLALVDSMQAAVASAAVAVDADKLVFAARVRRDGDFRVVGDAVDDCSGKRFRQRLGYCSRRWTGDDEFVAVLGHEPKRRFAAA